jgi:hypothetical protein
MVVRINQLGVSPSPDAAGWPAHELAGPIKYTWPQDIQLYEVLILEQDEDRRLLGEDFRRQQLRTLIPAAVDALRDPEERLVVRLDGILAARELAPALSHVIDSPDPVRYAISDVRRLDEDTPAAVASVRVCPTAQILATLCSEDGLGLERTVRLRAFSAPQTLVNPLLDIDSTQDERWREILPQCGFILTTSLGLRSVQILTRRHDATAVKALLTQRLLRPKPRAVSA